MAVRIKTLNLVYIALFAVLIAICSWLAIPTIVPITLQTLAVYLTAVSYTHLDVYKRQPWSRGSSQIIP